MTFLAPAFLLGLAALPLLVWLHRRRQRPAPVDVPSLMFLEGETPDALAPERVRFDAELVLSLVAAAFLSIAAAGPAFAGGEPGRRVRVVVDRGPAMEAKAGDGKTAHERADEAVEAIRWSLRPADRLDVVDGDPLRLDLVSLAHVGDAGLRVVVSDRLPTPMPSDVRVVAVGDPNVHNVGIVAVDVSVVGDAMELFTTVWNDGPTAVDVVLSARWGEPLRLPWEAATRTLQVPGGTARSSRIPFHATTGVELEIQADDLVSDDRVGLSRDQGPLTVRFDSPESGGYPVPHQRAVRDALDLLLGKSGWHEVFGADEGGLEIGELLGRDSWPSVSLLLHPIPSGTEGQRPPPDAPRASPAPPLGADLDFGACDLVYAPGLLQPGIASPTVRRPIRGGELERREHNRVEFVPDPLAGHPAPVDTSVWPVFFDNFMRWMLGRPGPAGYRIQGSALDLRASRLGRDVRGFDPRWLDGVRTGAGAAPRNLRPFAIGAALLALALLWASTVLAAWRRVP